jgi:hypothetical protein
MLDPIDRLRQAADELVQSEQVPPVHAVQRRLPQPRPARQTRLLPALAAAAALTVAVGAQQLVVDGTPHKIEIPPPPALSAMTPPLAVAKALGAPGGHTAGPPVESAQILAVAPPEQGRDGPRTVGVERPRDKPDAQGRPLVDRCISTYAGAGDQVLANDCRYAQPARAELARQVTVRMLGTPGDTVVAGTAPPKTAAVLLRAAGQDDLVIATAVASPDWDEQVFYTAQWPRIETTVTALDSDGAELSTTVLPSGRPERRNDDDPELGTLLVNPAVDGAYLADGRGREAGAPRNAVVRVDVLARSEVRPGVTRYTLGAVRDGEWCVSDFVQNHSGDGVRYGGGGGCGPGADLPTGIRISRSFSAASAGHPEEHLLMGSAPPGTAEVVLSADRLPDLTVRAYDAGPRWRGVSYFIAAWPSAVPTRVTARAIDGRTLAATAEKGMSPNAFDPRYLEAHAVCMERGGVKVTRRPQDPAAGPAYEYDTSGIDRTAAANLERSCEAEAEDAAR